MKHLIFLPISASVTIPFMQSAEKLLRFVLLNLGLLFIAVVINVSFERSADRGGLKYGPESHFFSHINKRSMNKWSVQKGFEYKVN